MSLREIFRGAGGLVTIFGLCVWTSPVTAFSWGNDKQMAHRSGNRARAQVNLSPAEALQAGSRLPNIYAVALSELQELESEPLCHRVAARLLVNNCQLLDGKDEATMLTDTGRQVRDFVDSYAASLAICDLERGSFAIPSECTKFRETALSQLAIHNDPRLHVSSREIDLCLAGLASSDAAWNTWISYRHKALRFCEAARADNEKAQSILLYQRLTKAMGKLADGVEAELQKRMTDLDLRAQQTSDNLERLTPQIDRLRDGLARVEDYMTNELGLTLRSSVDAIQGGLDNASNLQQLLAVMLTTVLEGNSRVAAAHEQSLARTSQRVNDEVDVFVTALTTAVASSVSLQNQIEISQLQAAEMAQRQTTVEEGLQRLLVVTESLSSTYSDHKASLSQAKNITNDLLDTLEDTASAVSIVHQALSQEYATSAWWPFVVCPAACLVLGSYGLPPSAVRNLGLLVLGEVVGYGISSYQRFENDFTSYFASEARTNVTINVTTEAL